MIIQVSVQGNTLTVTNSIMTAMAACRDHVLTTPPVTEILEIDIWHGGVISGSYGFTPLEENLNTMEEWLYGKLYTNETTKAYDAVNSRKTTFC
ncbi:hypothetical protein CPTMiller_0060 [Citrobacter phage Miller]|jgi:hypothetical protein|uniref:Uncharacterized protein n=4 Tax=Pseudotevenvirus TaxID=2842979 RepID=A0A1B1IXS3_9CAUD|nr:hypothetical protein CPTMiller_0060 [Citrobacter phage Miller]YP_009285597.1 hypothetical protein BI032_gp059 [Citrobacter phage vB_CfrM_CfP1]YP_239036.1 RB43ORF060w hypothetical protein [Escherichia phage RB43]QPX73078.1 hypothetical protein [Citrobacter phage vB_Cfr_Xman]CCK73909.1 protein of unknown function [Pseudotevenvirus RB43]AAX78582.1 RB43ORF060w hypothetical protein [Escherichia phage RB43]AIK67996.1 hypothetical protein CPTMiller_0060 [Citrobacter phage Miller]ANS06111.1 hypot